MPACDVTNEDDGSKIMLSHPLKETNQKIKLLRGTKFKKIKLNLKTYSLRPFVSKYQVKKIPGKGKKMNQVFLSYNDPFFPFDTQSLD
jgi:hypothetical protein